MPEDLSVDSQESAWAPQARQVPAGRAIDWWQQGFAWFTRETMVWVAWALVVGLGLLIIGALPLLGPFLTGLVLPPLAGGVMLACAGSQRGETLTFEALFAGFRAVQSRELWMAGLAGGLALSMLTLLFIVVAGPSLLALLAGNQSAVLGLLLSLLVSLGLSVPLTMAFWFAPALIVLDDVGVRPALLVSFQACLRNVLPFLVYGLVGLPLMILATMPLLLGWLVLGPMALVALYLSYCDIFSYHADRESGSRAQSS